MITNMVGTMGTDTPCDACPKAQQLDDALAAVALLKGALLAVGNITTDNDAAQRIIDRTLDQLAAREEDAWRATH